VVRQRRLVVVRKTFLAGAKPLFFTGSFRAAPADKRGGGR